MVILEKCTACDKEKCECDHPDRESDRIICPYCGCVHEPLGWYYRTPLFRKLRKCDKCKLEFFLERWKNEIWHTFSRYKTHKVKDIILIPSFIDSGVEELIRLSNLTRTEFDLIVSADKMSPFKESEGRDFVNNLLSTIYTGNIKKEDIIDKKDLRLDHFEFVLVDFGY